MSMKRIACKRYVNVLFRKILRLLRLVRSKISAKKPCKITLAGVKTFLYALFCTFLFEDGWDGEKNEFEVVEKAAFL